MSVKIKRQDIINFEVLLWSVLAFVLIITMITETSYYKAVLDIVLSISAMFLANHFSDIKSED